MSELVNKVCTPCQGGVPALKGDRLQSYLSQLQAGWQIVDDHHLEKEMTFDDFKQALDYTNRVGAIAEQENHHPNIYLTWGKVTIRIFTHKVDGLTENDFILAAKLDELI